MRQGVWRAGLKGLGASMLLGVLVAACGPVSESEAPGEEVSVEQGGGDVADEAIRSQHTRPLPPERSLALSGPSVAYGHGKFLVVWQDVRAGGVYGSRLRPDGSLVDPEGIRLNVGSESGGEPVVAYDGRNFMVVWLSGDGIFGVRVRPDGTVLGPVFTVITSGEVDEPAIACSDKSVCLVTFTIEGDDSVIGVRRVRTDGTVLPTAPGSFLGVSGGMAAGSSVAWNGREFLVVWTDSRGGEATPDIYGGRVRLDGTRPEPTGFPISTAPGAQRNPDVAWTGRRFLTVWEDNRAGEFRIFGARVRTDTRVDDPAGIPISATEAYEPAVAHQKSVSLVVWGAGASGASFVAGARVDEDGVVLDPDRVDIATEMDAQFLPDVAYGGNRFLAVYAGGGSWDEPPHTIRGNLVTPDAEVSTARRITRAFEAPPAPASP